LYFILNYHTDESISQRRKSGIVIVAEWDGEILATGSLVGAEITGVFVRADLQGKNLGSLVMNRLESLATENGHKYVELSISLPSRGFYEKRGYRITQPASIDMGMGQSLDYWEGRKIFSMR
jgi:GNAT superfamily N-acetyltransferase